MTNAAVTEVFRAMLPYYLHERARDFRFLAQQRRVCTMLDGRAGRVLDIGCGPGLMTGALVARGWEVWGLDCLEPSLAWARAEAVAVGWASHARYVAGDAETLPFSAGAFDAVIAMGVLEYLADAPGFVAEAGRVLRPGGLLVVDNATSHQAEMAPFVALVSADREFVTSLVPVGNGEFLAVKADQGWSEPT